MTTICLHQRATITFYEEKPSQYMLEAGEIAGIEEDFEPYPLTKIDVACPDCRLTTSFENWHDAPEPLHTYCQRIYQREYRVPDPSFQKGSESPVQGK